MDIQRPTSLPYTKITHSGADANGWVVVWEPAQRKPPVLGNKIALGKDGIGTVVIRDGLRCGTLGRPFESIASIPITNFKVVAGSGYKVLISNTNPRGSRTWEFDLAKTCAVGLTFHGDLISLEKDPAYDPVLR